MKNMPERQHSRGKAEGGAAYRAPQLLEFGDLAARTQATMGASTVADAMPNEKTS
jgi:hypothetical protein